MDRDEDLKEIKERALVYLEYGPNYSVPNAITSILSDLSQSCHDDLKNIGEKMTPVGLLYAMQNDETNARNFIVGFR